jgi:hypothetical protein
MRNYLLIIASMLILIVYLSTGCKKDEDTNTEFRIQVDSLKMPDTITVGDVLSVDFYGLVGDNSCYNFSRFNQLQSGAADPANSMRMELLGIFQDNGNCQAQDVYMNPVTANITGIVAGDFALLVVQPNGSVMTGTCHVKEE